MWDVGWDMGYKALHVVCGGICSGVAWSAGVEVSCTGEGVEE